MVSRQASERKFLGVSGLLFAASLAATILWSGSTSHGMAMGDMAGESGNSVLSFLALWLVMMAAMMLPSLVPMLSRYRRSAAAAAGRSLDALTSVAGLGYFAVWAVLGVIVFLAQMAVSSVDMNEPALAKVLPIAGAVLVVLLGLFQFSKWKAQALRCCRTAPQPLRPANAATAWRHGLRLGIDCARCCANLTAILLILGMMNLAAMALVTAAITLERLAPPKIRAVQIIGTIAALGGMALVAQAAGLA